MSAGSSSRALRMPCLPPFARPGLRRVSLWPASLHAPLYSGCPRHFWQQTRGPEEHEVQAVTCPASWLLGVSPCEATFDSPIPSTCTSTFSNHHGFLMLLQQSRAPSGAGCLQPCPTPCKSIFNVVPLVIIFEQSSLCLPGFVLVHQRCRGDLCIIPDLPASANQLPRQVSRTGEME